MLKNKKIAQKNQKCVFKGVILCKMFKEEKYENEKENFGCVT